MQHTLFLRASCQVEHLFGVLRMSHLSLVGLAGLAGSLSLFSQLCADTGLYRPLLVTPSPPSPVTFAYRIDRSGTDTTTFSLQRSAAHLMWKHGHCELLDHLGPNAARSRQWRMTMTTLPSCHMKMPQQHWQHHLQLRRGSNNRYHYPTSVHQKRAKPDQHDAIVTL